VRAARHTLESVLELADQLETEKLNADAAARRAFAAERDARRERARREAADVRFDALSRLYVAKFKEEVRVDADTRNATEPPASGALKKLTLPKEEKIPVKKIPAPVSRSFASAVTDDIDAVFREARELFLRGHVSRIETCHEDSSLDSTLATSDVSALSSSTTSSFEAEAGLDFVVDGATRETKDDRRQSDLTVIARLGGSVGAVHTNYRRETLPGWTFTGVVKDTKFRKKCPIHEGPCADCCSTTRVPFRPTKGGTGHGDPLCPKCLVLRREHRTSTSDWNGAKNGEKAF
jgi:hypothetical protein